MLQCNMLLDFLWTWVCVWQLLLMKSFLALVLLCLNHLIYSQFSVFTVSNSCIERGLDNGQILTPLHVTTVCGGKESGEMFWQKELQVQNLRAKKSTALLGHCRFFGRSGFWKASVEVEGKEGARPQKDLDVTRGRWNFSFPQANGELLKNSKKAIASLHNLDFVKKEILPQWQCEKWT